MRRLVLHIPDKIADRIAGAIVDLCYTKETNPKVAVEVLIGHNCCLVINETSVHIPEATISHIVERITGSKDITTQYVEVKQDTHLSDNQKGKMRCGDNGIFKGVPMTKEQHTLRKFVELCYSMYPYDSKFVISDNELICCQSNVDSNKFRDFVERNYKDYKVIVNPLGDWSGGINVDSGATNRKLGSDMGDSITGGGLHGKDLSKADVSVNIYAWLKAQQTGKVVELHCSIGDEFVDGRPYSEIVEIARDYINDIGGFEKFAEYGIIR